MDKLSPQEEEAMIALWKTGKGIIKAILENVTDTKTPYTTFASTIKNLQKKGYVDYKQVGNVYEYFPLVKENDYKKNYMKGVVQNYFENSYKDMVSFFAEEKKISAEELNQKMIVNISESKISAE